MNPKVIKEIHSVANTLAKKLQSNHIKIDYSDWSYKGWAEKGFSLAKCLYWLFPSMDFFMFASEVANTYALESVIQQKSIDPTFNMFNNKYTAEIIDGYHFLCDQTFDGVVLSKNESVAEKDVADYYFILDVSGVPIGSHRNEYKEHARKLNGSMASLQKQYPESGVGAICFLTSDNANHNVEFGLLKNSEKTSVVNLPFSSSSLKKSYDGFKRLHKNLVLENFSY